MPHEHRKSIDFTPTTELQSMVRGAIKVFHSSLKKDVHLDYFYRIVSDNFEVKLSNWCTGTRNSIDSEREFTEFLIRIFDGTVPRHRISSAEEYGKIIETVRGDHLYANKIEDLLARLKDFKNHLIAIKADKVTQSAKDEFVTAMAKLEWLKPFVGTNDVYRQAQDIEIRLPGFPYHVPQLCSLIASADKELVIQCDAVDFASFRDYDLHRQLIEALKDASVRKVRVDFLMWADEQPMSWANRFRKPDERNERGFRSVLESFCKALTATALAESSELKLLVPLVSDERAVWGHATGEIQALLALQMRLHNEVKEELRAAGIRPRIRNRNSEFGILGTAQDEPPEGPFYWIADRSCGIFVFPKLGQDAGASLVTNKLRLEDTLTDFYQRFDYIRSPSKT
ncbi:MAG TPA: hypothetical protein VGG36_09385 [Rhizomicrobium sp.]